MVLGSVLRGLSLFSDKPRARDRYPLKQEPWLGQRASALPDEAPGKVSRQVARRLAMGDKEKWRVHRSERLLMRKLDRMRKIRRRCIERGEIVV